MTIQIFLVFLVILGALFLFVTEKLPVDLTAFLVMLVLMALGIVFPDEFPSVSEGLSGFSSSATITVLAMFVLSSGVQKTGAVHKLGKFVFGFVGNSEVLQILAVGLLVAPISGFINNTAAVAIMLPMILDLSKRSGVSATKLLIPLSFFAMLGGTLTLIGTSTNILASEILQKSANFSREIGMFEFLKLGLIVLIIGFVYIIFIGRFLLPDRKNSNSQSDDKDDNTIFLTEVVIKKGSKFIGKTLHELKFSEKNEVQVLKIVRGGQTFIKTINEKILEENDILVIKSDEQRIIDLYKKGDLKLLPNFDEDMRSRTMDSGKIVKVLLRSASLFHDRSLDEIKFWKKFGAIVVGIDRDDFSGKRLGSLRLKIGEILLIQASSVNLQKIKNSDDFLILETIEEEFNSTKMKTAIGIVAGVVLISAFTPIPILIAALSGILLMVLTKCIQQEEIYDSVSWVVIFLLAGIIPLGVAMEKSGAASFLAGGIQNIGNNIPPIILLGIFYLITTIMTEIISNNAAVILLLPVAISVSEKLNLNPFPFALAVMFSASTSFLTPVGYQTNTMVYGSGNYKFSDFIKIGGPLNLILLFATTFFISLFWPLSN